MAGPGPEKGTGQDKWSEALTDAVDHVKAKTEAQEKQEQPPKDRRPFFLAAGFVILAIVWGFNIYYFTRPIPPLSPQEQMRDLREEISYMAQEVQAYFDEEGRLPTPAEVGFDTEEWLEYTVVSAEAGQYTISATEGTVSVTYDGTLPLLQWVEGADGQGGGS